MHAFGVAQQQVEFAQRAPAQTDRQIGGQQFDTRRGAQGELPEAFVIQAEAAQRAAVQPIQQWLGILLEAAQPVAELAGLLRPGAGAQRVALGPEGVGQQWRRDQRPGQVAHHGLAQLIEQAGEGGERLHAVEHSQEPLHTSSDNRPTVAPVGMTQPGIEALIFAYWAVLERLEEDRGRWFAAATGFHP
ncbi:hypothetical protein D3C77_519880 [compost metagenome]